MTLYRISQDTFKVEEISKKDYKKAKMELGRDYPNFITHTVKNKAGSFTYDEALFTSKLEAIDAQIKNAHEYFAQAKFNYLKEIEELKETRKIELQQGNL